MESSVHVRIAADSKLHVERRCMRREHHGGFDSILVAPIVRVLAARVLNKPIADGEALISEVAGFPNSVAVWVTAEELLGVRRIAH